MKNDKWNKYYKESDVILKYPDENLVRMIKSYLAKKTDEPGKLKAIDLGCGTGRHMNMMNDQGIGHITGVDTSINALAKCHDLYGMSVVLSDNKHLSFKNDVFDIAVAWGSLHYCEKENTGKQLEEIYRIIRKGGVLFGTLRSMNDTYLKKGKEISPGTWITDLNDLKNSIVSFFDENELCSLLNIFSEVKYGLMERTLTGDLSKRVSHWFYYAVK